MQASSRVNTFVSYAAMCLLAALFLLPVLNMLIGSMKSDTVVISDQTSLVTALDPTPFEMGDNYSNALDRGNYLLSLRVSLIVSGVIVAAGLVVNSLFGYALARLRFTGRRVILAVVIALIIVPFEAIAVPLLWMMSELRWTDTLHVQFLPFIAQPLYIYLFYSFFRGLPVELEEAARVDGAGPYRTFWKVVVPLARPAYASAAILTFLYSWGQFLWPVMATRTEAVRPLPVGIAFMRDARPVQWSDLMAYATLMILPVFIVFVLFQRRFVQGVASSGIRG